MTSLREFIRLHKVRAAIAGVILFILFGFYNQLFYTIGMRYNGTFYSMKVVNGITFYSAVTDQGRTDISVSEPKDGVTTVTYQLGNSPKKTYLVSIDPYIQDNAGNKVVISENGGKIFQGTWSDQYLTDENGKVIFDDGINVASRTGVMFSDSRGNLTMPAITNLALHQYDTPRGRPEFFTPAVFILLMTLIDMLFPLLFFSIQHSFWVKDPEPNEFYLAIQKMTWIILPIISLVLFILALC